VNVTWIYGAITGLSAILGAYLVAWRKLSGTVKHSEAQQLWDAMKKFSDDLVARNNFLRDNLDKCESKINRLDERIDRLERRNQELDLENGHLKRMTEGHEETIAELREQIGRLSDENVSLRSENTKLKRRVRELEKA
jgi:regulator of replication initiation timing